MRVLFLDMDGVINCWETFKTNPKADYPIDPVMVERVNKIIESTGCMVVLSSVWRLYDGAKHVQKKLSENGFRYNIHDVTPNFTFEQRGVEIESWMKENNVNEDDIVILDDDSDMANMMHRLVKTSMAKGLTDELTQKTIDMFLGNTE